MPQDKIDPIRPADEAARNVAQGLLAEAKFAALAVFDAETGAPMVTRVGFAVSETGEPLTLISDLSTHTHALRANPAASLLVGEPGTKGDPLTHPRLTLQCRAEFVERDHPDHPALRARYLAHQPKAKLYIDFGDFRIVRFKVEAAHLNGGFGKAYRLTAADLTKG